jgi:hypothetical protein
MTSVAVLLTDFPLFLGLLGYLQPLPLNFSPYITFPPISPPIFSSPAAVPLNTPYTPLPL